jgi:GT2 family glycosyltransferase
MPDRFRSPSEAVVICTRNRPRELERTLRSITSILSSSDILLGVVDASDAEATEYNRRLLKSVDTLSSAHWRYTNEPSLARQRNYALNQLPSSIEFVHFVDDDVTVQPGYFEALSEVLRTHQDVGGVGGVILEKRSSPSSPVRTRFKQLFFLSHPQVGQVLPSGCTTSAQHPFSTSGSGLRPTEWLSGCSSTYRRALLEETRFDDSLTGYAMLEDLDLSYRMSQVSRLVVQPRARLHHRRSTQNRFDVEQYNFTQTVHRRWFVEKHGEGVTPSLAYWWSVVGRIIALVTSSREGRYDALRGFLRGVRTVLHRDHDLLRSE